MDFSLMIAFLLLALPPVVVWLYIWGRHVAEREPACVLFQLFFFGVFSAIPLMIVREYFDAFPEGNVLALISSSVVVVLLLAFLEELVKAVALIAGIEINRRWFDSLEDGFEYAMTVALGFAFAENAMYFLLAYRDSGFTLDFGVLYFMRSLLTALAHVVFTGAFGFAYAYAYLKIPKKRHEKKPWRGLGAGVLELFFTLTGRHHRAMRSGFILVLGFAVAVVLHTAFNLVWTFYPDFGIFLLPAVAFVAWRYARHLIALR